MFFSLNRNRASIKAKAMHSGVSPRDQAPSIALPLPLQYYLPIAVKATGFSPSITETSDSSITEEGVAFTSDTFKALLEMFLRVWYLIIDEKSMVGLDMQFWVEQRCREIFPSF